MQQNNMERKCYASAFIAVITTLAVMDWYWLSCVEKNNWALQIRAIQGENPVLRQNAMISAYLVMTVSILALGVSRTNKQNWMNQGVKWGALVGLAMYGTYNATNYAIFKDYMYTTATTDTTWGVFLSAVACAAGSYASEHIKLYQMLQKNRM